MIRMSANEVKQCSKCGNDIYTHEPRDNRDNGHTVHLKGQCPNVMDRPPGSDNPVVGVDSIQVDNRKFPLFFGIMLLIIMGLLSGCSQVVSQKDIELAIKYCEDKGGVFSISVIDTHIEKEITCRNGDSVKSNSVNRG